MAQLLGYTDFMMQRGMTSDKAKQCLADKGATDRLSKQLLNPQTWLPAEAEVAEVLELSLAELQAGYGRRTMVRRRVPFRTDTYLVGEHLVWGATARMLADLFDRLGPR